MSRGLDQPAFVLSETLSPTLLAHRVSFVFPAPLLKGLLSILRPSEYGVYIKTSSVPDHTRSDKVIRTQTQAQVTNSRTQSLAIHLVSLVRVTCTHGRYTFFL